MKKFTIILTVLIALTINANAQIPNSGFENWTTVNSYDSLLGWGSTNYLSASSFYAVTKSTDIYPATVGVYSIRIENNTALLPSYSGVGLAMTGTFVSPHPVFQLTGHPNSFTGYYKYAPLNGDTMCIGAALYLNGNIIASAMLSTNASVSNWTSFNIPFSTYTTADSCHIFLAAYYAHPGSHPLGNSILYVDNINFDNLITSVSEQTSENTTFSLYPNPASDIVTLNIGNTNNADLSLNIYNVIGNLVKSEILNQNQINIGDLTNGIYMIEIKSKEWTEKQKLIIQR